MNALYENAIPEAEVIDLDKACDGIVWLLSKMPASPGPLLFGAGGASEEQIDTPYGPAFSLKPQQVVKLNEWLQTIDVPQLRPRYDPKAMDADKVYPQVWIREGMEAFDEYLLPHYQALRSFLSRASQAMQYVLVFFM